MTTRSKTGISAALTQVTAALSAVTISIPANKGGSLIAIEVYSEGTLETVVNGGGLVAFHNSAEHWEPLEFFLGPETCVSAGAIGNQPMRLLVNKPLPGNSSVTVDYTPQDNQSQKLTVTLIWEMGPFNGKPQTFAKAMTGSAVTSTARATAGTVLIPGGHGGTLKAYQMVTFGVLTTVVNLGGLVEVENDAIDLKPSEFYQGKQTCVTSGAEAIQPYMAPQENPCVENSTFTFYYTPQNAASQLLAASVIWES